MKPIEPFIDKNFEYGGTVEKLKEGAGDYHGVYIIALPENFGKITLSEFSNLKIWRGRKVAVSVEELKNKWVKNTKILYIGKAESKKSTVKKRVLQHKKFWSGENVAAWGGRIIGQIQNFKDLDVWYLECDNPYAMEKDMLQLFKNQYKKLPFANWRR